MKPLFLILIFVICFSCKEENTSVSEIEITQTSVTILPYFDSPDFTPKWDKVAHKIPKFSFTNQDGLTINNATYKGKIYVADFFFTTCPGICPKLAKVWIYFKIHTKKTMIFCYCPILLCLG